MNRKFSIKKAASNIQLWGIYQCVCLLKGSITMTAQISFTLHSIMERLIRGFMHVICFIALSISFIKPIPTMKDITHRLLTPPSIFFSKSAILFISEIS